MITYNILANKFARGGQHSYCPDAFLDWSYRSAMIKDELARYDCDLVCLQEVEDGVFDDELCPWFARLGYAGLYSSRQMEEAAGPPEGVALFYRQSMFRQLDAHKVDFSQEPLPDSVTGVCAIQSAQLCAAAARLLQRVYGHTDVPLLIGGDFNSLATKRKPDVFDPVLPPGGLPSGVYQLLTSGALEPSHPEHPYTRRGGDAGETGALVGLTLSACGLRLSSVNARASGWEPPLTTRTATFAGCLDYVFASEGHWGVAHTLEMPYLMPPSAAALRGDSEAEAEVLTAGSGGGGADGGARGAAGAAAGTSGGGSASGGRPGQHSRPKKEHPPAGARVTCQQEPVMDCTDLSPEHSRQAAPVPSSGQFNRASDPVSIPCATASSGMSQRIADMLSPLLKSAAKRDTRAAAAGADKQPMPQPPVYPRAPSTPARVRQQQATAACPSQPSSSSAPVAPMTVYAELHTLIASARNCALPPARTSPQPWTPNYPTTMLALSASVPPTMTRPLWCLADYQLVAKLYKGYASNVFKAVCKRSNQVVVLKVYTLSAVCNLYKYQIFREIALHSRLQHENVVALHAAWSEGDNVIQVQEYAEGADLFTVLQRYGGRISERLAVQLVLEPFLKVLSYLHSCGIAHRDIKPENILFSKDMVLKLADFGLAIDLRAERAVTRAGTLDYMCAPEVLACPYKSHPDENKADAGLHYSGGVDAWSVGVLTFELLTGAPPFYDTDRKMTEARIKSGFVPTIPAGVSWPARDFMNGALNRCPIKRTEVHEMLSHAWVSGFSANRAARVAAAPAGVAASAWVVSTDLPVRQAVPAVAPTVAAVSSGLAALPTTRSPPKGVVRAPLIHAPPLSTPAKAAAVAAAQPVTPPQRAATPVPGSAANRLLQGSASLQEYLQGQVRRVAEAKRAAAAAPQPAAVNMCMLAAGGDGSIVVSRAASPGEVSPLGHKGTPSRMMSDAVSTAQGLNARGLPAPGSADLHAPTEGESQGRSLSQVTIGGGALLNAKLEQMYGRLEPVYGKEPAASPSVIMMPIPQPQPVVVPAKPPSAPVDEVALQALGSDSGGSGGLDIITSNPIDLKNPIKINGGNLNGNLNI
ncbi:hypothetical protein FOA52_016051 [Chlamydomonas sp. UWO 241]|nr:hypothetical protein FOA52_016051 [Chlamydomonas sp. UWO 241]